MIVRELLTLLGFKADPTGAKAYEDKLRDTQTRAERTSAKVGDAFRGLGTRLNNFHSSVANGLDRISTTAESVSNSIGGIVSSLGGGVTAWGLASLTSEYTDLHSRLQIAVGDVADATEVMSDLRDIANLTWQPINQTIQGFLGMRLPLEELGLTIKEQQEVLLSLNDSMTIGAIKGEQAARAQMWLNRALGEGKISAGGFNELMEAADPIMDDFQKHLGLTTSEFQRMGREGELTATMLVEYFRKAGPRLREQSENMAITVMDAFQRLRTNFEWWIFTTDKAVGASSKFADIILWFADRPAIAGTAALSMLTIGALALTAQIVAMGAAALATGWQMVKAGVLMLANPMTWVWIAVGAAIAGVILLVQDLYTWMQGGDSLIGQWLGPWDEFAERISAEWAKAWADVQKGFSNIGQAITQLGSWAGGLWDKVKEKWSSAKEWMSSFFSPLTEAWEAFSNSLAGSNIIAGFQLVVDLLTGQWGKFLSDSFNAVNEASGGMFDPIKTAWASATEFLKQKWDEFWGWVSSGVTGIGNRIGNWFSRQSVESQNYATQSGPDGVPVAPGNTQGRERGGDVRKDRPYIVGEGGEEVFYPDAAGKILPARESRREGGEMEAAAAKFLTNLQDRLSLAGPRLAGAMGGAAAALSGPLMAAAAVSSPASEVPQLAPNQTTVVNSYSVGDINVSIPPGSVDTSMDPQQFGAAIAKEVSRQFNRELASAQSHFANPEV